MGLGFVGKAKLVGFIVLMIAIAVALHGLGLLSKDMLYGVYKDNWQQILLIGEILAFGYACACASYKPALVTGLILVSTVLFTGVGV